jgi:Zn-dependent protease
MSSFNLPLGRWLGVPVVLHWSWVLLFLVILGLDSTFAVMYAALFFIVLLHELGHVLAAKHFSCYVRDIVLYPIGGAAYMMLPSKPKQELVVALAGPMVNVLLLPILWLMADLHEIMKEVQTANLVLLIFNLVPAFPMDGGRVLRSILSWCTGKHYWSTWVAARVGQGFAVLFVVAAVVTFNFMLIFVAYFVFTSAEAELSSARTKFLAENGCEESMEIIRMVQERLDQMNARHNSR